MAKDISNITINNMKDLIEVMSFYNIRHVIFPESKLALAAGKEPLRGIVCDHERTIYI